jgi:hypothetical protein
VKSTPFGMVDLHTYLLFPLLINISHGEITEENRGLGTPLIWQAKMRGFFL